MPLRANTPLGPYVIEALLGAGGMGEVYRARDTRLERLVAIKILADAPDAERVRARLVAEARAASALSHPHICTIYEVGEIEGRPFIAMEYVEGGSLGQNIPHDGLPAATVARYGVQIADALAHAHDRGIVHRDLKSANVIITPDGRAKILDFGLATRAPSATDADTRSVSVATTGAVAGTLPYMPPEVLRGQQADARGDVWSLGVLLYEMATGTMPFRGQTAIEVSSEILKEAPAPFPPRVPASLRRVIERCLQKAPGERYRRAGEVVAALDAVRDALAAPAVPGARQDHAARAIAVLPFRDLAQDPANASLGLGLADATITELAMVRSLLVRPTAAILRYADAGVDPLQAGRDLGVDAVVHGAFQRAGSKLRVTVQLIATDDGRSIWGSKVSTSLDDVFEMQDEVSRQVAKALEVELTQADERRLARSPKVAAEAYVRYTQGRAHAYHESVEQMSKAIELFEQAVAFDSQFAAAYAGLSDAYLRFAFTWDPGGDWYARAEEMCGKALALDPDLPEGHHLRGRLAWSPHASFDHALAIREFATAVAAKPNLNESHHWLGIVLFHVGMFEESIGRFERAIAISPDDMVARIHVGYVRYLMGDFPGAIKATETVMERDPSLWSHYQLSLAQLQIGQLDAAERTNDHAVRTYPGDVLCYPLRALVAALRCQPAKAEQQIEMTVKNRKGFGHYHHAQYDIACTYAQLGRTDDALRWLDEAAHNGFPCQAFFERDPLLAPVRGEARFRALMGELKAECDGYRRLYDALRLSNSW